jgi:flagellar biosynthetic protein FliO
LFNILLLLAVTAYIPAQLNAQEAVQESEESEQLPTPDYEYTEPDFGENRLSYPILVLRTIAVLAVIIIGIYLIFRFLLRRKNPRIADSEIIKVLANFPLAANKAIQVVEIAEKILVLGVTDSNINLITTLEDKETIDKLKLLSSKETETPGNFKEQFLKLIGGKSFPKSSQISYFSNYKKRINRMKKL